MDRVRAGTLVALLFSTVFLFACEGMQEAVDETTTTTQPPSTTPPPTSTVSAASLAISASQTTVRSDNSDSATITITALDANRAAVEGVNITLSATAGQLSSSGGVTDATGQIIATFSSGTTDPTNASATVTATAAGAPDASIPIQIAGSTATISLTDSTGGTLTSLNTGETATVKVTATDAGGNPVNGANVTLSVAGTGAATIDTISGLTGATGTFTATLTASSSGDVTITAEALGDTDSATLTVQGASTTLQITDPTASPAVLEKGQLLPIVVSAPNSTNVTFVTSHGQWDNGGSLQQVVVDAAGQATANLTAAEAGTANVQVFDSNDSSLSDALTVAVVVTTVDVNSTVTLQPTETTVPVSTTTNTYSTTLTASVKDSNGVGISGAPVVFSLSNTTGGGEYVSPSFGTTGLDGKVTATFTSGTNSSSSEGVLVTATVYMGDTAVHSDTKSIIINQTAASVIISGGSEIKELSSTTYAFPFSVHVADSAGNAVAGQVVTLRAWPRKFATGFRDPDNGCEVFWVGEYPNEDLNRNTIKDPGEDIIGTDYIVDNALTPASSVVSLPVSVTTDENGVGQFDLVYGKDYAEWIQAEITATTLVGGSESNSTYLFWLHRLKGEACNLRSTSPFNYQP